MYKSIYFEGELPEKLSEEELKINLRKYKEGDMIAYQNLIKHNIKFIIYVINNMQRQILSYKLNEDLDDFISIGVIGLIKAIENYKADKNINFLSFAKVCISNEIKMFLRKNKKQKLNTSLQKVINADSEGNNIELLQTLSSNQNIEDDYMNKVVISELKKAVESLGDKEKDVILMKNGINSKTYNQKQIADKLGVSQSLVSRIEKKVIQKLSRKLQSIGIIDLIENKDIQMLEGMSIKEKVIYLANIMITTNLSGDKIAKKYNITRDNIRKYFNNTLKEIDFNKYIEIQKILFDHSRKEEFIKIQKRANNFLLQNNNSYTLNINDTYKKGLLFGLFLNSHEEDIMEAIDKLEEEEKNILLLRYPLGFNKRYTISEISKKFNTTEGVINNYINNIIKNMRQSLLEIEYKKNINYSRVLVKK